MAGSKLRVGYVPEHFSSPILWLGQKDNSLELVSCPSGTGQMIQALQEDKIDVAVALTESLIAGIVRKAADYRIVGQYVSSPLNWAVITGKDTPYNSIADLRGKPIGVSRMGSGSQIFASYMALREKWFSNEAENKVDALEFKVLDTFKASSSLAQVAIRGTDVYDRACVTASMMGLQLLFCGSGSRPSLTLTQENAALLAMCRWAIVAQAKTSKDIVKRFLQDLDVQVQDFNSRESRENGKDIEFIKKTLGYPEQDIKDWLKITEYPKNIMEIKREVVMETLRILENSGVVEEPPNGWNLETFVDSEIAKVI